MMIKSMKRSHAHQKSRIGFKALTVELPLSQ